MKDEITIRRFQDMSKFIPKTAACLTSRGRKMLTFHGTVPGKPNWLRVSDQEGNFFLVSKTKLANLVMERKE